jgi:asparagine synthase (glutamine-hydrolysing)
MCGIAGIMAHSVDQRAVQAMLQIMQHRGPDYSRTLPFPPVCLGHCRLSINDLTESASQPFVSDDEDVAVIVNGEIYNYFELKEKLEAKGRRFFSRSDSEVVFQGYLEEGLEIISKLNGMFAIAIWDGRIGKLFLIRDRLGIKPLYYTQQNNRLIFASEIKALAVNDDVKLDIEWQSFFEYLSFENYFSNRTLNKDIHLVLPGEIVETSIAEKVKVSRRRYWAPTLSETSLPQEDIYQEYRRISERSLSRHLLSDVPLGTYLSGGIDSSTVAYWASQQNAGLKTYTGDFGLKGFYDEKTHAQRTAREFGCDSVVVDIGPEDFVKNFSKTVWHLDEPRVGMGSFSQLMVAKRASKDVKVVLTGHGGDEFFAGYPVFKAILANKKSLSVWLKSSAREKMYMLYFLLYSRFVPEAGYFLPNIFTVKQIKKLLKQDYHQLLHEHDPLEEPRLLKHAVPNDYQRLFLTYLQWYLPALFVVEDKISMAYSLESRTPLCDNELLDFALSIPLADKLKDCELKHIPRTAMRGLLPDFLYSLPKRGFPTPLKLWFRNELSSFAREFIMDRLSLLDMFDSSQVEKLVRKHTRRKVGTPWDEIGAHQIWMLMNLAGYFENQKKRYKAAS